MNFKKWVKSIQTAGYNGARTVYETQFGQIAKIPLLYITLAYKPHKENK